MHYFDLLIRLKTEQEHLFRNIQRSEYHNLFDFIRFIKFFTCCHVYMEVGQLLTLSPYHCSGKGLKIMNLGDVHAAEGVAAVLQNEDDDAVDPHLERIRNEAGGDESDDEVYHCFLWC